MFGTHFYHETIRRAVAVFGTLFNDIGVVRRDSNGNVLNAIKVPLAYGPRQKFLSRIEQQANLDDAKIALKLPRMSFEITSLTYDTNTKMQKGQRQRIQTSDGSYQSVIGPVGYRMGMQLNIMAKNQDDALQILEQIVPFFQPEYSVTIKQVQDQFRTDMPFVLQGVTMNDDYEGDYLTRRSIIYTLDFETRVRFYGPVGTSSIIRKTQVNAINQNDGSLIERQLQILNPFGTAETDPYTVDVDYNYVAYPEKVEVEVALTDEFEIGDIVFGTNTLASGSVEAINTNNANHTVLTIQFPDGNYSDGESLSNQDGSYTTQILGLTEIW
jgi:hypothetical protein